MVQALCAVVCVLSVVACADEKFSSDAAYTLAFSQDTVAFDTLITTTSSRTKTLIVYNPNKYGVRLSRVELGMGALSPFRVNVDGSYLVDGVGDDFEVFAGDSITVRIEVNANITAGQAIEHLTDKLCFRLENGRLQNVLLHAGVMDADIRRGIHIYSDSTLTSDKPIVVLDSFVVDSGRTLVLPAGTTLMFHYNVGMQVYGTLKAQGTLEHPVVMRSDETEHMFDSLYYDNTPSRWLGIYLSPHSTGHELDYCDVHASVFGILYHGVSPDSCTLRIANSTFYHIGGDGLALTNCRADVENTQVSNTMGHCVIMNGGSADFVHCTLAQFYPFHAQRGHALYLIGRSVEPDETDSLRHLRHAHFLNCVITGYGDDVIMGNIQEEDVALCDYLFSHCYLNTVPSKDSVRFVNIVYDNAEQKTPKQNNFVRFNTVRYEYDFTPVDSSAICGLADSLHFLPYDRLGRSRLEGRPDAGCYQHVPNENNSVSGGQDHR